MGWDDVGQRTPEFDLDALAQYKLLDVRGRDPATILTAYVTFIFLGVSAAFLSSIQLIGDPIECWCPAETSDSMCNYTKSFCWTSKLYIIDMDDPVPFDVDTRYDVSQRNLNFYPLVPFILVALAAILRLPDFIWNAFMGEEGLNIPKAAQIGTDPQKDDEHSGKDIAFEIDFSLNKRFKNLSKKKSVIRDHLDDIKKFVTALGVFPLGAQLGTYQTGLFMFTRLLSVALTIAAFPGLGYAINADFARWGWDLVRGIVQDDPDLFDTRVFPQETLCDFKVRQLQNVQDFTVQCVLPINMWSEKVFLVLWFWLALLVVANSYSYQYWFRKLLFASSRRQLVSKHLAIMDRNIEKTRRVAVTNFALTHLTHDSIIVLKMLELCASDRIANVVVKNLWEKFNKPERKVSDTTTDRSDMMTPGRKLSTPIESASEVSGATGDTHTTDLVDS